jgi:hypothetical protein
MNKWISVEIELPPETEQFLVTDGCDILIRSWDLLHREAESKGLFTPARHGSGMEVKYWMPLPELPI